MEQAIGYLGGGLVVLVLLSIFGAIAINAALRWGVFKGQNADNVQAAAALDIIENIAQQAVRFAEEKARQAEKNGLLLLGPKKLEKAVEFAQGALKQMGIDVPDALVAGFIEGALNAMREWLAKEEVADNDAE